MLRRRHHARGAHALHRGNREPGDDLGIAVIGTVTDDFADAVVEVDARGEAQVDAYGAVYEVAIADPTKPVSFIVHRPNGDAVPTTREPGGDRSFVPAQHNEIWLKQGDPTVYTSPPG